ncbi:uncharacterized protein LOC110028017 [Phalaenopsis equestris]|uniref:uncharacterized protein LOC110028017 n=1 Tax=Phalaenopsis equestris TaxID=78828 RepID=UPI0009E48A9E|nr:uncharacterized protein LOC110028017 [Phalaenopsis equestris]
MATDDRKLEPGGDDVAYKTKVVQFLGRSTPIVLQNDNGPCPLLAICNVLLLRNSINLSLDAPEVPLQKLLSLVAGRLIDSNCSLQDKDDGYLINQQQNIADAIDLLPRLATGIDVNVQFRKINDFEFTRECAIFDLLDIGLYHGWIVDPQDSDTAAAIGSKSYNALAGDLVSFEAGKSDIENKKLSHNDSVDFVAATTATLGVPSPSLSRSISFDYCQESLPADQRKGKGDKEEEEELMRILNLSRADVLSPSDSIPAVPHSPDGTTPFAFENSSVSSVQHSVDDSENFDLSDKTVPLECDGSSDCNNNILHNHVILGDDDALPFNGNCGSNAEQRNPVVSVYSSISSDMKNNINEVPLIWSTEADVSDGSSTYKEGACLSGDNRSPLLTSAEDSVTPQLQKTTDDGAKHCVPKDLVDSAAQHPNFQPSLETKEPLDVAEVVCSLSIGEPIYEGEDHIIESRLSDYEDQEPIYEGEMVLAEQAMIAGEEASSIHLNDQVTGRQCQLIKNFLEGTASQLTIYGLFCLQEGLKERELCVFFRNNHFSTMFKFNGELYLLVTDQGYMNQPDVVWEKLNEVNGDTVFMTGNFTQFNPDNQANDSWNEQNAINNTTDYLATLEGSTPSNSSFNSDLQLAIALQQQEFEQQPQQNQPQQQPQSTQQSSVSGRSKLVTGPQVPRNTNLTQKSESKLKEKCAIM